MRSVNRQSAWVIARSHAQTVSLRPRPGYSCAMPRPIQATIHTQALRHNLQSARARASDARAWAVVKANAYGHGIERAFEGLRGAGGRDQQREGQEQTHAGIVHTNHARAPAIRRWRASRTSPPSPRRGE